MPEYVGEPDFELWTGDDVSAPWTDSPKLTGDGGSYDPVTMAGPLSHEGGEPAHVRLRDVRDDGFEIKAEEWKDQYGHTPEKTHAIHLDRGLYDAEGGNVWDIQRVQCEDDDWSNFYLNGYHSVPRSDFAVLATIQTHNGDDSVVPRIKPNGSAGWKIKMQEEKGSNENHYQETVGVMAVEKGQDTVQGRNYEAGTWTWPDGALGWRTIEFDRSYYGTTPPLLLASIQTFNGSEPCNLRYRNLTANSVEVKLEESPDSNIGHLDEEIGYLVMESPYISPEEYYQHGIVDNVSERADPHTKSYTLLSSQISTQGGFDTGDEWMFEFDVQGHGVHRHYNEDDSPEQGWKADGINEHYIDLYDSSNIGDFSTSTAEGRIGGNPAPKLTSFEILEKVVTPLAQSAIASANKYVSGLMAASEVYDSLTSGYSKDASDDDKFRWKYSDWDAIGDKHSDVVHHLQFWYVLPYGESSVFNVEQDVQGPAESFGRTATTVHEIEVGSPNADTMNGMSDPNFQLLSRKNKNNTRRPRSPEAPNAPVPPGPESLSKSEKKKFGMRQVRQSTLDSAGIALPDEIAADGDMVWQMTRPPINISKKWAGTNQSSTNGSDRTTDI